MVATWPRTNMPLPRPVFANVVGRAAPKSLPRSASTSLGTFSAGSRGSKQRPSVRAKRLTAEPPTCHGERRPSPCTCGHGMRAAVTRPTQVTPSCCN
jgi:hypothetical protein